MDNNYFVYMYVFPNGKRYIGQSHDGVRRYGRITAYHHQLVRTAMDKYPEFKKHIIWRGSSDKVDEMERHFIYFFRTMEDDYGYNVESGGNINKTVNDNLKKKLSIVLKKYAKNHPEEYEKLHNYYVKTDIARKHNKIAKIKYFKEHPEELERLNKMRLDKEIIAKRIKAHSIPVRCIETGEIFNSQLDAAKKYCPKCVSHISRSIKNGWTVNGYHWEYIKEED